MTMPEFLQAIGYNRWILNVLLVLPMVGVAIVLLAPEKWARWLTLVVAVAEFVLALGLWWAFDPTNGGMQFTASFAWLPEWGISYRVARMYPFTRPRGVPPTSVACRLPM